MPSRPNVATRQNPRISRRNHPPLGSYHYLNVLIAPGKLVTVLLLHFGMIRDIVETLLL